jgi:hypothetical protein
MAFMPALALQSEIARPEKKAKPSVPPGFDVMLSTCSSMICSAPPGRKPESSARCWLIVVASAMRP